MKYDFEDNGCRQSLLNGIHRIVVKVGTRLLMDVDGVGASTRIDQLVEQVSQMRARGYEVILVTSGAIAAGMEVCGLDKRPKEVDRLQALAAIGQCELMKLYEAAADRRGFHCGQLLLTAADVHDEERHTCFSRCLERLLKQGALPVINENDSVTVDEIKVGDNDTLAALIAGMARAELTVLLTTVNGMSERDTKTGKLGRRISTVSGMDDEFMAMAQGTDGNRFSVGGMITKLRAASMVMRSGELLWIADGFDFGVLGRLLKGEDVGTLFVPTQKKRMHSKQRFIAFFSQPKGDLIVDMGAEKAVCKGGKSLLPSGILGIRGVFGRGDTVRVLNVERAELARGIVNFSHAELAVICGCKTEDLHVLLGREPESVEAIHRDNLVLSR